jgi:Post-segregation antitoxin CcdA
MIILIGADIEGGRRNNSGAIGNRFLCSNDAQTICGEMANQNRPRSSEGNTNASLVWLEKNRASIESWNAYVAKHGVPLSKYRSF